MCLAFLVLPVEPLLAEGQVRTHRVGDSQHRLYIVRCIECHVVFDALHGGAVDTQGILQHRLTGTRA